MDRAVITARAEIWPLKSHFRTSHEVKSSARTVVATIRTADAVGRGECTPYPRYGETPEGVRNAIAAATPALTRTPDRTVLAGLMPAGAARNALDCALWDLEAKRSGRRAWDLAGVTMPEAIVTAYTIGADPPAAMARRLIRPTTRPPSKRRLLALCSS